MKIAKTAIVSVSFLLLFSVTASAQVIVTGSSGADGNYPNLKGAFDAVNANPQSGNFIDIAITADIVETATAQLNSGGWASLTVRPGGAARTIQGNIPDAWGTLGSNSPPINAIVKLNGADNVTIDGSLAGGSDRSLTITNTADGDPNKGIGVLIISAADVDGATGNTVKNTIVTGVQGTTRDTGTTLILAYTQESPNSNNTVQNNLLLRATYGIYVRGSSTTFDQNWTIADNTIGSTTAADKLRDDAIALSRVEFFAVRNNTVRGLTGTYSIPRGIGVFSGRDGSVIGNRVSDVKQHLVPNAPQGGLCSYATGIYLNAAGLTRVANNFIWDVAATGDCPNGGFAVMGLYIGDGNYDVINNSVNMNTNTGSGHYSTAVFLYGVAGGYVNLQNNIFANPSTRGQRASIVAFPERFSGDLNYNNYYSSQYVGYFCVSGTRIRDCWRKTLANWRTAVGQDANSLSVIPGFVSAIDLHLLGSSQMINRGVTINTIVDDIDGQARPNGTAYDIGADEYVP